MGWEVGGRRGELEFLRRGVSTYGGFNPSTSYVLVLKVSLQASKDVFVFSKSFNPSFLLSRKKHMVKQRYKKRCGPGQE